MDNIILPLEHQAYSWLMTNISRTDNSSYFPFFLPTSKPLEAQHSQIDGSNTYFNFALQDVSLGFLSLLILQKSFRGFDIQECQKGIFAGKFNSQLCDIILANVVKSVIGLLLILVTLPLVLPIVFLFWLFSIAVRIAYATKFKYQVFKAEGMDGVWGLESQESRPFITICLRLSGEPNLLKIRDHIATKILNVRDESTGDYKFKKFRQTFSQLYGYYIWKDAEGFNLEDHIRLVNLLDFYQVEEESNADADIEKYKQSENETGESKILRADDLLHRYLSEESDTAVSADRSPWEVLLLLREDGSYNVVIRLHHAIGDGVSMMRVCVETLVDTPLPTPSVGPKMGNSFIRAALIVWSALVLPFGLLQVVANFDRNTLHGCHLSGKKIVTSSKGIPLSILKNIKVAAGATVNDVLMSCLSSAISKHFLRRGEDIDQITSVVPVSFHDLKSPVTLTNQFSVATVKLPVSKSHSSNTRLHATKTLLDGMKRDPTLLAVFGVVKAVSHVLPAIVAEFLLSGRGVTVAASNVPGPQQDITIWGDKVLGLQFWVPNRAPVGVGFSFASYNGLIKVGLNVDSALVNSREEAQQILDDLEDEVYSLRKNLFPIS